VQGAPYTGAIITAEAAYAGGDIINVFLAYLLGIEDDFPIQETGFRRTPQVQHHLKQVTDVFLLVQRLSDMRRQYI
jgi:hypothetical protein